MDVLKFKFPALGPKG